MKYLRAIYRVLTSKSWMLVSNNGDNKLHFINHKVSLAHARNISFEVDEMANECVVQEMLFEEFRNNK